MSTEGNAQQKREQRLRLLEDDIGRTLSESARNGELQSAPSYGKPLNFGDGYDETPAELRMPMKVLKDAGVVPPEAAALKREAADLRLALALRLERLRTSGNL